MFIAYEMSIDLIRSLRPVATALDRKDPDLANQLRRAASSVSLNLAEGRGSMKGNKQRHYSIAQGSLHEVKAAIECAQAWGWVDPPAEAIGLAEQLRKIMWKLTHPD